MIIEAILNLVKSFLLFLIGLFPTLPTFIDNSSYLSSLSNVLGYANYFVVLDVAIGCLVICFVVMNIKFIWGAIMWVVRKIPGVS